jgi:hypothetical protein
MSHARSNAPGLALFLALSSTGCLDSEPSESLTAPDIQPEMASVNDDNGRRGPLTVYTQNLFLGGDTGPLFTLDFSDPSALPSIIQATTVFYADVQASDIPGRAAAFVDELQRRRPDVVGMQEAVGYAEGMLNPFTNDFTPTAAGPDLLASVMAEIDRRGLPYSVAVVQPTTRIALPIGGPTATGLPAIAVQDRVVMLKHDRVEATATEQGVYQAKLPLGPADIERGWVGLTVERAGTPYHFVTTHLETQGSTDPADGTAYFVRLVHDGQAAQLQAILAAKEGVTVLMGDLNSDAEADPSAPSYTDTYSDLITAGFTDAWTESGASSGTGFTCCHAPGLDGPNALDERIDFVLVRSTVEGPTDAELDEWDGGSGAPSPLFRTTLVGENGRDRTDEGLWPSDHAGMISTIRYFTPRD